MNKKVLVLASDLRMIYAADHLSRCGYEVTVLRGKEDISEKPDYDYSAVLLPVRGTTDGTVKLMEENIDLNDYFQKLPGGTLVISGLKTQYETDVFPGYYCFQQDPEFVKKNSELTAEGVLAMLLNNTEDSIYSYNIDLVGYGNTGKEIYRLLSSLGVCVRVVSRQGEDGTISPNMWKKTIPGDVIINTVPTTVIYEQDVDSWRSKVIVIDIASNKVGVSEAAKRHPKIEYIAAPPLPGQVAPKAAGRNLAELLCKRIDKGDK